MKRIGVPLAALAVVCMLATGVRGAEVECDSAYCFSPGDFSQSQDPLRGILVTALPGEGTVFLGQRVVRPGDILTAEQISAMTFQPLETRLDTEAQITYLPIYENRVEKSQVMTVSIRGKEDKAPDARDSSLETYKNLPNQGLLQAQDPEGKALTYTLVRGPKRGSVEIREDGSFTYTPKKNKVGTDSFTYTAADPAGNVSRTATVTVQILKPTDARRYTDTVTEDCRFEAEWMRNTGLFVGENLAGETCFFPDKTVSRGEFLTMLLKTLDVPVDKQASSQTGPAWLRPYLAAAERSGLTAKLQDVESWNWDAPISGAEAAVMVQNALDLQTEVAAETVEEASLAVMAENGIALEGSEAMTRGEVAKMLYRVSDLSIDAPGMSVFRLE